MWNTKGATELEGPRGGIFCEIYGIHWIGQKAHPSAITVPVTRLSSELISSMAMFNVPVFTHPVVSKSDFEKLPKGVGGIYSATLCQ